MCIRDSCKRKGRGEDVLDITELLLHRVAVPTRIRVAPRDHGAVVLHCCERIPGGDHPGLTMPGHASQSVSILDTGITDPIVHSQEMRAMDQRNGYAAQGFRNNLRQYMEPLRFLHHYAFTHQEPRQGGNSQPHEVGQVPEI